MIRVYRAGGAACEPAIVDPEGWAPGADVIWIDLIEPTADEDRAVERALGLSVPTRAEMAELEASSRVYRQDGATYATADLIVRGDDEIPGVDPVTFILGQGPLVTIRYSDPRPFALLADKLAREPRLCGDGAELFLHLMEAVVDRASDILSKTVARTEGIATHVFSGGRTVGFERLITKLGQTRIANSRIEQSLAGLARIFAYLGPDERMSAEEHKAHLASLRRDVESLQAHSQAVAGSIDFQLSAALGLINIEQSSIIKIFSVAAVAFLPPTLIASIYGMNFEHMPELPQPWGYPAALVAMVVSAILPLVWFRRKGWL